MASKLYLVRHGAIGPAGHRQFIGSTDLLLNENGEAQARRLASLLQALQPDAVWVSPMQRARQTADLALPGLPATVVEDLREINFGRWEGKTFDQIAESDPELVDRWYDFDTAFVFPEGEGLQSFLNRIKAVAADLAADPAESIAVVTHGGVIRSLVCHFLGLCLRQYLLFNVKLGSVSVVELFNGRGVLNSLSVTVPPDQV